LTGLSDIFTDKYFGGKLIEDTAFVTPGTHASAITATA
jgi:hypothetical protein